MLCAPCNIIIELKKMLFLKFYVENNFCYIIYSIFHLLHKVFQGEWDQ